MNYLPSLRTKAAAELELRRRKREQLQQYITDNPADFIEQHVYDPDIGRITLHPEQRAVLEAMSEKDDNGFIYSTWLFSAPKKSAKTTIGAGVALWQAWQQPFGEIYIIGNDLRQADNRMAQIIRHTIRVHPTMRSHAKITESSFKIVLANGTRIDTIPVDPRGESGMNPTGLFWTEAWGAIGEKAERMWSEATLSPTRRGRSFKFVESYAGFSGQSLLLVRLYNALVKSGVPHDKAPELYTNGSMIGYWCTRRYLSWQVNAGNYYHDEEATKTPSEFRRQHGNEWVSSENTFIPIEWWDACRGDLPPMQQYESLIIAVDAAVTSDCFAVVAVSRRGDQCYLRYAQKWTPPKGGQIDFSEPEAELKRLVATYPVTQICYDPYQLEATMQRLRESALAWIEAFPQGTERLVSDKRLYDTIRERRVIHSGEPDMREHITNANSKTEGDRLRIVKRQEDRKVDMAVALSMAVHRAYELNIG